MYKKYVAMHNRVAYTAMQHQITFLNRRKMMTISVDKFVAPLQQLAALNAVNFERMVSLQLEGIEEVATATVESVKKAASVKDLDSAKSYYTDQTETVKGIVDSAVARNKTVAEMVQSYPSSVKKIVDNALAIG